MNRKQLTLLIVLGVVLGGLGYVSYKKRQSSFERGNEHGTAAEEGQKLLKGVPASAINDVAQLTIKSGPAGITLSRSGEQWTVKERGGYPANFITISELVKKFWDVKITRAVEAGPSRLPVLKLTKAEGTLVELKDDKGKSIATLTLGKQMSKEGREDDSPFGGGAFPTSRYVMRGDDLKTIALVSDPLSVETKPEDWLNKDWFKVEKLKSVAVVTTNATNNWKLMRETEGGDWKFAATNAAETLDGAKTGALSSLLTSPSFNDVLIDPKPDQAGLDKAVTATLETFEGFTYTLKLGRMAAGEETYAVQMSVAGNFPKERAAGKDEKPEDKTRLDKEFADKTKRLAEKLKADQAFEKWTFTVSKWTVDSLLKDRKEWLAEKKEEPKKEPEAK